MDKQPKAKEKAKKPPPGKAKSVKGKTPINEDKFRGNGISFKGKLVGISEVSGPRGDNMCITAIRKLKLHALKMNKEIGEHKQKIVMNINLKGVHLIDEKTQLVVHDHMINKVSYITHDPEDKRTFGYIVSVPSSTTGHQLFALKTEKPASTVTAILYELFQVVYKLRQEAQKQKTATPTTPVKTAASVPDNGAVPVPDGDGIYEEPSACTPPQSKKPVTPHYKIPARSQGPQQPLPQRPGTESSGQLKKDEDTGGTKPADGLQYETPTFDSEPIFGNSFIAEAERKNSSLSESGSMSSVKVFRNDSVSSSSSDAQQGEHIKSAVFSPTADSFPSSSEGTSTTSIQQNLSFEASFPAIPSTDDMKESAGDRSTDNHLFSDNFPSDSSFGNTAENQSLQTNFPDDSPFGFPGFPASETFKADFPDHSTTDSNTVGPSTGGFASFEAAFPADSFTANQHFDSSFSTDSSSTTMKQTLSGDPQKDSTDVDWSLSKDLKETEHAPYSLVSGAASGGNKPDELKFKNASSDAQVNGTENTQCLDDPFKSAISSEFENELPTIDLVNNSKPFEASQHSFMSVSNTNEVDVNLNQAEEDSGTSEKGDDEQGTEDVDSVSPPESSAFKADFDSFPPSSEMSNASAVKIVTNDGEAFSLVARQEAKDVTSIKSDFDPNNAFENLQEPNFKSPETIDSLFSSNDLFSAPNEEIKISSLESVDPFIANQEVQANETPNFVTTFEGDAFFSTPFEFNNNGQSETRDTAVSSDNVLKEFPWQDTFGNDMATTNKSVSAVEINVTSLEQQLSVPDTATVTTSGDVFKRENFLEVNNMSDIKNDGQSSNKQDPFCEFEANFDAFDESTTDTTCNEPEKGENEQQQEATVKREFHTTVVFNDARENHEKGASVKEKPTQLDFISDKPENHSLRPISPNAPPPLPPRPTMTLPSLPPRPKPLPNKSIELETPPIPPLPQTDQTRKLPPALPPRIDLQSTPEQKVDLFTVNDPFGVESKEENNSTSSAWGSSWPSAVDGADSSKQINDHSDTFDNDFFTTFEFSEKSSSESTSTPVKTATAVADPFGSTCVSDPFGSDELFSQSPFTSSKSSRSNSIKNVFGTSFSEAFGTKPANDPFSDISDPFAGKGDITGRDPFLDNPDNKDIKLQEDFFTDSFA